MKKMWDNKYTSLILCVCCFILGFIIAKYIYIPKLTLQTNIDGIAIINIAITILIAVLIYKYFDKNKEDRSREKELLLKRAEELYHFINTQSLVTNSSNIEYGQAAANHKRINLQIKSIEALLIEAGLKLSLNYTKNILDSAKKLRDLQTNSPPKPSNSSKLIDLPITVKSGIIYYSKIRMNEVNVEFDNLKNLILKYQLQINRA